MSDSKFLILWFLYTDFYCTTFWYFSLLFVALFLIRDSECLEDIPKEMLDDFVDQDQSKVKAFKEVISSTFPVSVVEILFE